MIEFVRLYLSFEIDNFLAISTLKKLNLKNLGGEDGHFLEK